MNDTPDADFGFEEFHIADVIANKVRLISDRREEILTAFVAKYGFQPDRLCVIHQSTPVGWNEYVVRLTDEDIAKGKASMAEHMAAQWQPIATAPTHTSVLVWDGNTNKVGVAHCSVQPAWYWDNDESDYEVNATHWLPLPNPPKGA
jgi:hypothetical protein